MEPRVLLIVMAMAATSATAQLSPPAITCTLPGTVAISTDFCNAYDEQGMTLQTQSCEGFLTMADPAPASECCRGLNNVAYNRTACICKLTLYPAASHNVPRQLELPRLCGVLTDLCAQCSIFLTSLNGTNPVAVSSAPYSYGTSTESKKFAITLGVFFGVLLLIPISFGVVSLIRKMRAKSNPPENFEARPPGEGSLS